MNPHCLILGRLLEVKDHFRTEVWPVFTAEAGAGSEKEKWQQSFPRREYSPGLQK